MKRYLTIVLLILVLVGALGYLYYAFIHKGRARPLEDALLPNTSFYISTNTAFKSLPAFQTAAYANELNSLPALSKLTDQLLSFDSILRSTGYTLSETRLLASLYSTGADDFDWLFLVDGSTTDADVLIKGLQAISGAKVDKRIYKNETVLDIWMPSGSKAFSCASINGILMGSYSAFLVEECIVQLKEKEPLTETDGHFRKINNLINKEVSLTLVVNPKHFRPLASQVIDETQTEIWQQLAHFSSWMALDVNFRADGILMGGYAIPDSTGILATLNRKPTHQFGFDKVLPNNTTYFVAQELVWDLEGTQGNTLGYLNGWMQPYVCYGFAEPLSNDYTNEWFLIAPVTDEDAAKQSLQEIAAKSGNGAAFADSYENTSIGRINNDTALVGALGLGGWLPLSNPYYALSKGHVVFANDLNTLKEILRKLDNDLTLASNIQYADYAREVSTTNNLYVYLNPAKLGEVLPGILRGEVLNGSGYKNYSPIGLQFSYDDGVFFTIALAKYGTGTLAAPSENDDDALPTATDDLAWRVALEAPVANKPTLVTNHNTNELEILVQDTEHNLYLINRAGKILWKQKLDGPIMGEVYQVDLYKNNKLQYLFNTQQKLHLLDRNGNNVEQFPIALASKAVNGLYLTGDSRNFQYFVACDNYKVYGYTANGKPLQGWNPKPRVGTISWPLQVAQHDGKDYLVLTNIDGTLLYYNKSGDRHEKPIRLEAKFNQPFFVQKQDKSFQLVNASEDRMLFSVDAKGEIKETTAESLPAYYHFTGVNIDAGAIYVFTAADKVTFTAPELLTTATYTPKQTLDLPTQIITIGGNTYIIATSKAGNECYVLDVAGQPIAQPFVGNSPAAVGPLFEKDKQALVIGDAAGNLNAYKLP